ncbi:MAG: hypothetical protein ACRDDX_05675 [Cellulosilyticaceae bacterium]
MQGMLKLIVQQVVVYLQSLLADGEEIRIVIRKTGKPQITKWCQSIAYTPSSKCLESKEAEERQTYVFDLHEFAFLETPENVDLDILAKKLKEILGGCGVTKELVRGKVEGIRIEWDEIEITIEGIMPENIRLKRTVFTTRSILEVLALKPDWITKGGTGKLKDRMLLGFDQYNKAVFEGDGASYIINGDGIKYRDINESLLKFRKRVDVQYVVHSEKAWKSKLIAKLKN